MTILYMNNGKVAITEDGLAIPEFKKLNSNDRHSGKPHFNKCITYLYFAYLRDGVYYNKLDTDRKRITCITHLSEDKEHWKKLDEELEDHIRIYIDLQFTPTEQMLRKVFIDMDKFIQYLEGIPWQIERRVKVGEDKEDVTMVDNSKKKFEAMEKVTTLLDRKEKLQALVVKEKKDKTSNRKRIFDNINI